MGFGVGCSCFCAFTICKYNRSGDRIWVATRKQASNLVTRRTYDGSLLLETGYVWSNGSHVEGTVEGCQILYADHGQGATREFTSTEEDTIALPVGENTNSSQSWPRIARIASDRIAAVIGGFSSPFAFGPGEIVIYEATTGQALHLAEKFVPGPSGISGLFFAVWPRPSSSGAYAMMNTFGGVRVVALDPEGLIEHIGPACADFSPLSSGENAVLGRGSISTSFSGFAIYDDSLTFLRQCAGGGIRMVISGRNAYSNIPAFAAGTPCLAGHEWGTPSLLWTTSQRALGDPADTFWQTAFGGASSGPPLAVTPDGNGLFTIAVRGEFGTDSLAVVQRRDVSSGAIIWQTQVGIDFEVGGTFSMKAGPTVVAVTGSWEDEEGDRRHIAALDTDTGDILWQDTHAEFGTRVGYIDVQVDGDDNVFACGILGK